jgi:hypothetical protein
MVQGSAYLKGRQEAVAGKSEDSLSLRPSALLGAHRPG